MASHAPPVPQNPNGERHESSLLDQLQWACEIANLSNVDLFITDAASGRFLDCSRSAHERLGYSRSELLSMGAAQIQADPDHDENWVSQQLQELIKAEEGSFTTRHRCKNGDVLDVLVNHRVAVIEQRPVIISAVIDQTAQRTRELALEQQLHLIRDGESLHGFGSWRHILVTDVMIWSDQMHRICGTDVHTFEPSFEAYTALVHPDDRATWRRVYHQAIHRGEPMETRHRLVLPNGEHRHIYLSGQLECDEEGAPIRMSGTIADVSTGVALQQEMRIERLRDPLTQLPNKTATIEWLERLMLGRPYNLNIAIISIDLDGFQEINDSFGSEIGDAILIEFSGLLRTHIDDRGWIGRLGSDEFVVVISHDVKSFGDGIAKARELQLNLHRSACLCGDLAIRPTVCIGVSSFPEHGGEAKQLLQSANTALMEAKHRGRSQLQAYSTTLSLQIRDRLDLDSKLNQAISREQLRILIQPQSNREGRLVGGEVLVRWRDHQGKEIPPSFFIPIAEQSGLIFPISDWVLNAALEQISHWHQAEVATPRLAINISTRLLESTDRKIAHTLHEALVRHHLKPENLELEITETALLQNPMAASEAVRMLAAEGFHIAIDDFGTGYSSLELLRHLPVHKIKIDQAFIRNIVSSAEDQAIVQATITLAHGLNMTCLAEGVENAMQRACLMELGCDQFQGYLCGHPVDLVSFGDLLADPRVPCEAAEATRLPAQAFDQESGASIPLHVHSSTSDELTALRGAIDVSLDGYLLMQAIYSSTGDVIDFTVIDANKTACEYMRQEREHVVGETLCMLFPGVHESGLLQRLGECVLNGRQLELDDFVYENHEVFGDTRVYDIRAYANRNLLILSWRDVTQRNTKVQKLADGAALLDLLAHNMTETLVLLDRQERIAWVSPSVHAMTGWSVADWLHKPFGDIFASATGVPTPVSLDTWLPSPGDVGARRLRVSDRKGGWNWMDVSARRLSEVHEAPLPDSKGASETAYTFLLSLRGADEQELRERRLKRLATVDNLTKLLNRSTVMERLEERIGAGRDHAEALALLYIDCDAFKQINDQYGHAAGDAVLRTIGDRIRHQIRQGDLAARLGGDEFLVVLDGIHHSDDAMQVAESLVRAASEPIPWNDQAFSLSVSVGVVLHASGEDTELLLRRADHAMYAAKASGRNKASLG